MNTIPAYAHPVPVSADGISFRKVHGPRTQAATTLRKRAGTEQARILTARTKTDIFAGTYLAAAR